MRPILGALTKFRKANIKFFLPACLSVCPCARNNPALTQRISVNFDINVLFENLS